MTDNFRHIEQAVVVPASELRKGQRASRIALFNPDGTPHSSGGGGSSIRDEEVSKNSVWSSDKTNVELTGKVNNIFAVLDPDVGLISGMTGEPLTPEQSGMSEDEYGLLYSVASLHYRVERQQSRYSETKTLVPGTITAGVTDLTLGFAKAREPGGFNSFLFTEVVLDTPSENGPIKFKLRSDQMVMGADHTIPQGATNFMFPVDYTSLIDLNQGSNNRVFFEIVEAGVGASGLTATVLRSTSSLIN